MASREVDEVLRIVDRMIGKARAKGQVRKEDALMKLKAGYLYYARLSQYGDCNTCDRQTTCTMVPEWGGAVRVNCAYYKGTELREKCKGEY